MGSGADRQLAVYQETNSARSVVDWLCDETLQGLP